MEKLPQDIIREHIIPYTYCPQPRDICDDIVDYKETKDALVCIYKGRHRMYYLEWLCNDIERFMNNDTPFFYMGVSNFFVSKFRQYYFLKGKTDDDVVDYIKKVRLGKMCKEVNLMIGSLRMENRKSLIHFITNNTS